MTLTLSLTEVAKINTHIKVQVLVLTNILLKVEVLIQLFY